MDRQALRETLFELLEQETWESPAHLTDESNLKVEMKLDSVDLLSVALQAERRLGISIEAEDFGGVTTLGDLLDLLQAKLAAKTSSKAA